MKITMKAFATKGSVIKGDIATYEAQSIEDRDDCYVVIIHANREVIFNKNYWKVEMSA